MNGVVRFGHAVRKRTHLLFAGADVLAAARAGQGVFSHASLTIAPFERWLGSVGRAEDVENSYTIRSMTSSPGGHTLIVYRSLGVDRCFGLGRNEFGQLGLGFNSQESTRGLVEAFGECDEVLDVHSAFQTSFIRSSENGQGVLHSFGSAQRGLAGFGQRPARTAAHLQASPRPVLVDSPAASVEQVAAGFEHVLLLTNAGEVYATGCSTDGQCGAPELTDVWGFTPIALPDEVTEEGVAHIRAGGDTSALITKQGRLWTWGNSEYGQAGHGVKADQIIEPRLVRSDQFQNATVDFRISGSSSVLLDADGRVFTVGYGALGLGADHLSSLAFQRVGINAPVRAIRAGPGMAAAVTAEDEPSLFVWGTNGPFGRLGINARKHNHPTGLTTFEPAHEPQRVPLPLKALNIEDGQPWSIGHVECGVDNIWVTIETESVD